MRACVGLPSENLNEPNVFADYLAPRQFVLLPATAHQHLLQELPPNLRRNVSDRIVVRVNNRRQEDSGLPSWTAPLRPICRDYKHEARASVFARKSLTRLRFVLVWQSKVALSNRARICRSGTASGCRKSFV